MGAPKDPIKCQEWKDNISKARKGMEFSETHKKNLRKSHLGKKLSEPGWSKGLTAETDERVRKGAEGQRGRKPWNIGLTAETDERVKKNAEALKNKGHGLEWRREKSESQKKKTGDKAANWQGGPFPVLCAFCGKTVYRNRLQLKIRKKAFCDFKCMGKWQSKYMVGKNHPRFGCILTREHIKKILRRRIPSCLEKKFQEFIMKFGLPYRYTGDGAFFVGSYNPDFVRIDGKKVAIEVYAEYFKKLGGRSVEEWKGKRSIAFRKFGWEIIFFSQDEVKNEAFVLSALGFGNKRGMQLHLPLDFKEISNGKTRSRKSTTRIARFARGYQQVCSSE